MLAGVAAGMLGCGNAPTPPIASGGSSSHGASTPEPTSVGQSFCAGTPAGTPLSKAPAICQRAWSGYGVTIVPPGDILTETQGSLLAQSAVTTDVPGLSTADATRWANAWIRDFAWYIWGEEHGQETFLHRLVGGQVISVDEINALNAHATFAYTAACARPASASVAAMTDAGRTFFRSNFMAVSAKYVVVVHYADSCTGTATYSDGHSVTITQIDSGSRLIEAGALQQDPSLGDIWFTEAATECGAGAPSDWCAS